jgi:hypothetical protein
MKLTKVGEGGVGLVVVVMYHLFVDSVYSFIVCEYLIFVKVLFILSPHDEHRSSGSRPVKLCSDR